MEMSKLAVICELYAFLKTGSDCVQWEISSSGSSVLAVLPWINMRQAIWHKDSQNGKPVSLTLCEELHRMDRLVRGSGPLCYIFPFSELPAGSFYLSINSLQ